MPSDRPHKPSRPSRPPRSPRPQRPRRPAAAAGPAAAGPQKPRREEPWKITSRRPPRREAPPTDTGGSGPVRPADDGLERLQKVLAAAGLGSRRTCEELITAGRVEVDRKVITQLGTRIDPVKSEVRVDGEKLPSPKRVVYMLNKPVGVVTTNFDPAGRPRVVDLVPGDQRLFAIGRLDRMSEGLILVTNDGGLANLLAHPRYGVEKRYLVQVAGVPSQELLDKIRRGITLAEGRVHAKRVEIRSQHKQSSVLEMTLDEGKNREIRRMLARLGHKVHQLKRVAVGPLSLGNLLPNQWRQLSWTEIEALRQGAIQAVGVAEAARIDAGGPEERPGRGRASDRPRAPRAGPGGRGGQGGQTRGGRGPGGGATTRRVGPGSSGPRKPRRPGKASSWRKPRG